MLCMYLPSLSQAGNHKYHYSAMQIANMLVAAKADDVCILDVSSQCSFTEHMVLATGRSHRHIQAAAAAVAYQVSLANASHIFDAAISVPLQHSIGTTAFLSLALI